MQPIASSNLLKTIRYIIGRIGDAAKDLLPIVAVISFFQLIIFRQPLSDLSTILVGSLMVVIGLSVFMQGLESQIETCKRATGKK